MHLISLGRGCVQSRRSSALLHTGAHSGPHCCRFKLACRARRDVQQHGGPQQQQKQQLDAGIEHDSQLLVVPLEAAPAAPPQRSGFGVVGLVGVLAAAALAAGLAYRKAKRSGDPFSDVNTIAIEELDPDMIAAARERRSLERANYKLDLDDVELPDNHPWATRKPVTAEQEAAIQARLQARPRRPAASADMRAGVARQRSRE